jgi:Tol biopolymer transport system component
VDYSNQNLPDPNGQYDLRLNLFHVSDGATTAVTGLLSPDYPANFQKNAEAIKNLPEFSGRAVSSVAQGLYQSFLGAGGIESAAWSPDSRYLAFAGEMDGPSSDLYVFDSSQQSIRRLSSGSTNIVSNGDPAITWSADGKWILYTSAYFVGEGMTVTFHAARPDDSQSWDFTEEVEGLSEWVSPSAFLTNRGANGIGSYGLRINNLDTGGSSVIWRCSFQNYRYDPGEGFTIVESHSGSMEENCQYDGLYFWSPSSAPARLLFSSGEFNGFSWIGFLGQGDRRFLVYLDSGTFAVSSTGEKTLIGPAGFSPTISPDRKWVAFAGKGLRVMDAFGKISELLTDIQAEDVNWRPDSKGFLFTSGSDLYTVSLPDETINKLDGVRYPSNFNNIYWQPDSQGYFFTSGSDLYFLSLSRRSMTVIQRNTVPYLFDPAWVAAP